jgi:peptide-methionine (R)-S-oxide reductase
MKDDETLKKENPELYRVARESATEPAFSGKKFDTKAGDMFHCAVCGAELFKADTKFESGSGWPSFTDPAKTDAVILKDDDSHGMHRTEVQCKKCGAHLGHVFPDGPKKAEGGVCDRFCINSVSLELKKSE